MTIETIIGICCLVLSAVCYAVYRYASENVYMTYKEHRFSQNKKGAKK